MKKIIVIFVALIFGCSSGFNTHDKILISYGKKIRECTNACVNMRKLHCQMGNILPGDDGLIGTEDDIGCMDNCYETYWTWYGYNLKCLSDVKTCDNVGECAIVPLNNIIYLQ